MFQIHSLSLGFPCYCIGSCDDTDILKDTLIPPGPMNDLVVISLFVQCCILEFRIAIPHAGKVGRVAWGAGGWWLYTDCMMMWYIISSLNSLIVSSDGMGSVLSNTLHSIIYNTIVNSFISILTNIVFCFYLYSHCISVGLHSVIPYVNMFYEMSMILLVPAFWNNSCVVLCLYIGSLPIVMYKEKQCTQNKIHRCNFLCIIHIQNLNQTVF
jgi:hypothetical protein